MRRNSSCIWRRISGSSAENGSSRNHSSGSTASDRAMPTRCLLPARELARVGRLTTLQTHELDDPAHPFVRSGTGMPCRLSGNAMLSKTFRWGSSPKFWNTIPILWRRMSISSLGGFFQQVLSVEPHFAARRLDETGQAPHDRGLARPGKPHDDEDLADMDVEADVDDSGYGAVRAHAARELVRVIGGYVPAEVGRRPAAIDLPEVAARQLDLRGVGARACMGERADGGGERGT